MIDVQNRTPLPGKEGRVTLTQDNGEVLSGILGMADEATQGGTPWNRQTSKLLQADIRAYPVAAGQSITAGDVVDVVGGEVTNYGKISSFPVGSVIQLNENGSLVDYIIVHQGKPSSLYDDSCNGAWVLRKDIFISGVWHNSDVNDYANSTVKAYLNSTFLSYFDSATQAAIKQVKIPYRVGSSGTTVNSGENGLSCKIFLLSGYEVGFSTSDNLYFPVDGFKLSYFDSGTGTTANNKRIAIDYIWWLRSPVTSNSTFAWAVSSDGNLMDKLCSDYWAYRPAFILPSDFSVTGTPPSQAIALNSASAGQNCEVIYSGVASLPGITEGQIIQSAGVYGIGALDGVLQVWSKDRPGQVLSGAYIGTNVDITIAIGDNSSFAIIFADSTSGVSVNGFCFCSRAGSAYGSSTTSSANIVNYYASSPDMPKIVGSNFDTLEIPSTSGFTYPNVIFKWIAFKDNK